MSGKIICEIAKCVGCRNCQIACALSHSGVQSLQDAILLETLPDYRLKIEYDNGHAVPNLCRHCADAPCIAACKFDALLRQGDDGPVLLQVELCKGCKKCVKECPFGVLKMRGEGKNRKVVKCDFCIERLQKGDEPACVDACPTGALRFVPLKESEQADEEKAVHGGLVEVIEIGK